MNSTILDKLKIKKTPLKQDEFNIKLASTDISYNTIQQQIPIIDKTDGSLDYKSIINKIKSRGLTIPTIPLSTIDDTTIIPPTQPEIKVISKTTIKPQSKIKVIGKTTIKLKPKSKSKTRISDKTTIKPEKVIRSIFNNTISLNTNDIPIIEAPETIVKFETFKKDFINKPTDSQIIASKYYMNNREYFINFINSLYLPYKTSFEEEQKNISCESRKGEFSLLTHQKIVKDYINSFTPYRGVLIYHGLGSGKTCSSIAIAEGLKTDKQIVIMTPASLRMNYIQELKMCGDFLYKKNQYWEFINSSTEDMNLILSNALNIPIDYITKNNGAWFVNMNKPSNYDSLNTDQKFSLDQQINLMIANKYKFINYNGLNFNHLKQLSLDNTINPFDNKVVVIDEVHNVISRIVNKLNKPDSIAYRIYDYLMNAKNCRIVLLSGTPIINYPNELAIIFNILRGYIYTYSFNIIPKTTQKIDTLFFKNIFKNSYYLDYIDYKSSSNILTITQNPFGFINNSNTTKYNGVRNSKKGKINFTYFINSVKSILTDNNIEFNPKINVNKFKALPDDLDTFKNYFINDTNSINNEFMFKRRILGLTSYLSDIDKLLPKYNELTDFHKIKIPMNDYQFGIYELYRQDERKQELRNAKKQKNNILGLYNNTSSTYRIFSRLACNFVFPEDYKRPMPSNYKNINENDIDADLNKPEDIIEDTTDTITTNTTYKDAINDTLNYFNTNKFKLFNIESGKLDLLSPKYKIMIQNILDKMSNPTTDKLHLIYSQFRTLEGIGIFKYVLEANGFIQFKIKKNDTGLWYIDIKDEDKGKPTFILYTGTETPEEKEILRNIFNSNWGTLPINLVDQLKTISSNNFYGEIIKIIMITSSGAEGISLRNVCYVHLMESYWHPVRLNQVIGRARRICSHEDLPEQQRTVDVYLYLMTFTDEQKSGSKSIELKLKDTSKFDKITPVTSDETLDEISTIKQTINNNLLKCVKESAFDCPLYEASSKENLKCYTFGTVPNTTFSFKPSYENEDSDKVSNINRQKISWTGKKLTLADKVFIYNPTNKGVYDYDNYINGIPLLIGKLKVSLDKTTGKKIYSINPI
jgi:hypothetical protein